MTSNQYSCKKPQPVYSNAALVATSKAAPVTVHNSVVAAYNSASARVNPVAQRVPIVPSLQNEAAAIIHKPMTVTATNTQMTNVVSSGVFCSHGQRDMNSSSRTFERHPVTPHQQQLHAAATHSKIYAIQYWIRCSPCPRHSACSESQEHGHCQEPEHQFIAL